VLEAADTIIRERARAPRRSSTPGSPAFKAASKPACASPVEGRSHVYCRERAVAATAISKLIVATKAGQPPALHMIRQAAERYGVDDLAWCEKPASNIWSRRCGRLRRNRPHLRLCEVPFYESSEHKTTQIWSGCMRRQSSQAGGAAARYSSSSSHSRMRREVRRPY